MSAQFLSSFTFNQVTFTHFRQAITPEDFKRINQASIPPLTLQLQGESTPSTPPDVVDKPWELQPENQKIQPTLPISMFKKVEGFEKAEYMEESDMESNHLKAELDHSGENRILRAKQEAMIKFEGFGHLSESTSKSEAAFPCREDFDKLTLSTPSESLNLSDFLRRELEKMISFVLQNMGKISQAKIENMRSYYSNNKCLLQIYDKLVIKYFSAKRCREDIVRYILRRAFREVRVPIMKEEKLTTKKASLEVCKKYFQGAFEELERSGREIKSEEDLFELLMPYTKKSKCRTMNTTFVQEVFASQKFSEDYQEFLGEFDKILAEDNNKKIDQFLEFLMDCIKKDTIDKIGKYKRFPWLDTWIEKTKQIAFNLHKYKKPHFKRNKI